MAEITPHLRAAIARIEAGGDAPAATARAPLGVTAVDEVLGGGLRRGVLHEVHAAEPMDAGAATGFALALAARLSMADEGPLVWISERMAAREWGELYGPGLLELGMGFPKVLLVSAHKLEALLVAAHQTAGTRTGGAAVLVPFGGAKAFDLTAGRRLALAAEATGMALVTLRTGGEPAPGVAMTRWRIASAPAATDTPASPETRRLMGHPRFRAELIRNRGGRTGAWTMEWNSDASIFSLAHPAGYADTDVLAGASAGLAPCPPSGAVSRPLAAAVGDGSPATARDSPSWASWREAG